MNGQVGTPSFSTRQIILLTVVALFCVMFFIGILMRMGVNNNASKLRHLASAQEQTNMVVKDKVWRILKQKTGITEEAMGKFDQFYGKIMDKNGYGADIKMSPMYTFIQSVIPKNFPIEMYKDLAQDVMALQSEFAMVQTKLIDLKREYHDILTTEPACWFLSKENRDTLKITIVMSTATANAFATGRDDDVELFSKGKVK